MKELLKTPGFHRFLRFEDGSVEEFGGYDPATTNNRMELQAALATLERLKDLSCHQDLKIRTDSKYLINGFTKWIEAWKRNGWRTSSGKPVLNKDLWNALDSARLVDVPLDYVKGHSGDRDNDRVDEIAVCFSKGISPDLRTGIINHDESDDLIEVPDEATNLLDMAPIDLQRVYSRLQLADHFSKNGYTLMTNEVAQLVGEPKEEISSRVNPWLWRDWLVQPIGNDKWLLLRQSEHFLSDEDHQNG